MLNILRIFISDAKRLSTNVVAVVVIIGLSVIPSLYAWFNILSNWDPYGSESTGNLSVAVATADKGSDLDGIEFNVGDMIIKNLKENDSINWVFTDTTEEAVEGVKSGDYYACLVIDESFSADLISFIGGDVTHPKISYYENEKINAIAPKITSKVKTTVQEEVNSAFVSTLASGILEVSTYISEVDAQGNLTGAALTKLQQMDQDLTTSITLLDSYISIIDTTNSLMDATAEVSNQLNTMMDSAQSITNSAQSATNSAQSTVSSTSDMVTASLNQLQGSLDTLNSTLDTYAGSNGNVSDLTTAQADSLKDLVTRIQSNFSDVRDNEAINTYLTNHPEVSAQADTVDADFEQLKTDLDGLKDASSKTAEDLDAILETVKSDITKCKSELETLSNLYTEVIKPQLTNTMTSVQSSLIEVESLVEYSGNSIQGVAAILNSYPDMMALGKDNLEKSKAQIEEMQTQLEKLISDMENLDSNDQYAMLMKLLETDPEVISDFISSPVDVNTEAIYAVENNGSAMAPFYVVLSIWVGAVILIAIVHTKVKHIEGVKKLYTYQEFFGRYLFFFVVGQIQTLITVLGALLYVKIQCEHPLLFYLAMALTSFSYTLLMYALTYAFEAVGEGAAVVLMVIQVAGSGGTFPIEVLPRLYQILYHYMPFAYSIDAARQCVAGIYGNAYVYDLLALCVYIGVALFIGLVVSIPCKRLNRIIDESKERTDLMA